MKKCSFIQSEQNNYFQICDWVAYNCHLPLPCLLDDKYFIQNR